MKFLVLFLFCLVSVSVFVAADEEEDGKLLSFFRTCLIRSATFTLN